MYVLPLPPSATFALCMNLSVGNHNLLLPPHPPVTSPPSHHRLLHWEGFAPLPYTLLPNRRTGNNLLFP